MARSIPPLLPTPRRLVPGSGGITLRDGMPIVLRAESDDSDFHTACVLRDRLLAHAGVALRIETHARTDGLGSFVELRRKGERGEGYSLSITPEGIEAVGAGDAGLRYAVETLCQLVGPGSRAPACEVEDEPDLRFRGILLDVSRGKVPTLDALKELVDRCARLKLNALMLYTEHTFRFRRHPEIGRDASPLDAADVRELDAYAARQHVELIPTLQSLGHMEKVLALDRYTHLAETDRAWTLSPSEKATYELLRDLYDEYLPNFRSSWFNANCDEPFDLERGKSRARAQELGPGGVYLEHVERVRRLAANHGKRTMIWADVVHAHPERIPEIDRDLVLLDWAYEADHDFDRVKVFAENQLDFVACAGTSSWNSLFPRMDDGLANIAGHAAAARRHGARGLLVTDWGDFGHYNLLGFSWMGFAWGAQQAWSADTEPRDFDRAFSRAFFGDGRGEAARIYRALGAIHAAGFEMPNGSGLATLYFDDLDRAYFLSVARPAAIRRSLVRLEGVRKRLHAHAGAFARDRLSFDELVYAADSSILAARRGLAALEYIDWRRHPKRLDARGRRRLAGTLRRVAREQTQLAGTLKRLWLRRSRPSEFSITKRRLDRAIASLRRAARALDRDAAPAPPVPHPGFSLSGIFRELSGRAEDD